LYLLGGRKNIAFNFQLDKRVHDDYFVYTPGRGGISPGRNGELRGPRSGWREDSSFESVRAGSPSPAADATQETLNIDEQLVRHPSRTVLITDKGDSMIDAGIQLGDVVVIEKHTSANVGDIVVAMLDNEFTLKRFDREKGRVVLRPENKAYPVIRPKGDLEIFGVVVGQFRKYR
jgi:SOS-response transcriptional repressor LexA